MVAYTNALTEPALADSNDAPRATQMRAYQLVKRIQVRCRAAGMLVELGRACRMAARSCNEACALC
jgi:hypothetical protein